MSRNMTITTLGLLSVLRAHDSIHGYGGEEVEFDLPADSWLRPLRIV